MVIHKTEQILYYSSFQLTLCDAPEIKLTIMAQWMQKQMLEIGAASGVPVRIFLRVI